MKLSNIVETLVDLPENPVPESAVAGAFSARDGCKLRYACFRSNVHPPKGTVVIIQGRNECIEKYFETACNLMQRGFDVATFDLRGQGGSPRITRDPLRGYIDSFHDYVADLDDFFTAIALPDCRGPFYILGHSTGSLIAMLAAPMLANRVNRMVLCAPLIGFRKLPVSASTLHGIAAFLYNIGLGKISMGGWRRRRGMPAFEGNSLTSDERRFRRNTSIYEAAPRLALGAPSAAWINAALNAIAQVTARAFTAQVKLPILMIAAGADTVVSNRAIEEQANRLRSGALLTIDGARHEILQEADVYREQLLAAFDAFVPGETLHAA